MKIVICEECYRWCMQDRDVGCKYGPHQHRAAMSNIAGIFNPPASRPVETDNCAPCTAVQALMCFGGGWYMLLGFPLQDKNGTINVRKHPLWWQKSVRGVGVLLVGLGAYRVGELAQMAWHRYKSK
jgi:hypothetical protein